MSIRRLINLLAVWAVLLHSAAVLRHHVMTVDTQLADQSASDMFAAFCQGSDGSPSEHAATPDDASGQRASKSTVKCPVCSGMTPAAAVLPAVLPCHPVFDARSVLIATVAARLVDRIASAWPQSRAPPSFA